MNDLRKIKLPDYDSPASLKNFLDSFGFGMQKKFGQNFMIDRKIRNELVSLLYIEDGTKVWEVGAGLGAMTELLLEKKANLTAFEIDKGFASCLKVFFADNKNFYLVEGDVQKTWRFEIEKNGMPNIFFGNLPYNIALQLISSLIEKEIVFDTMLITVQKEAAMRMTAKPEHKNYTVLSVLCGIFYDLKIVKTIPAAAFWPQPNVESSAILFTRKKETPQIKNFDVLIKITKALFSSRRKTIKNNLADWLCSNYFDCTADQILQKSTLKKSLRAESLTLNDFIVLADAIETYRTYK